MSLATIDEINALPQDAFTRLIGLVFEHSPWIAERTWIQRPFTGFKPLYRALCKTVTDAGPESQLALIRAHPDLAGRLARAGQLTRESSREQAGAGLDQLTPDEIERLQKGNDAYKSRFGFPFIICARLNQKDSILAALERRLPHSREQEVKMALEEIFKIAELRLRDLIAP